MRTEPADELASRVPALVDKISLAILPPGQRTRSAWLALTVPAVATFGTKIVKEAVSEQPPALVTSTVTVECWVIAVVLRILAATSAIGAGAPLIEKEYVYPGTGGPAVIMILPPEQIVSPGALEAIDADASSPKKSTRMVISSVNVHESTVASTFILSPLLNSPGTPPSPAVAVTVLEGPAAPRGASFTKNLYVSAPAAAETVICSPAQKEFPSTPVSSKGS